MMAPFHLFIHRATLRKGSVSTDEGNGVVKFFDDDITFRCRIWQPGGSESQNTYGDQTTYTLRMYCSPSVNITEKDRVVNNGTEYVVETVDNNGVFKTIGLSIIK